MKHRIVNRWRAALGCLTIILLAGIATGSYAQEQTRYLFSIIENPVLNSEQEHYIKTVTDRIEEPEYLIVNLDPSHFDNPVIRIELPGVQVTSIYTTGRKDHKRNFFSWFGIADDAEGTSHFAINQGKVTGTFFLKDGNWMIKPITGGLHILFREDLMPSLPCETSGHTDHDGNEDSGQQHGVTDPEEMNTHDVRMPDMESAKGALVDCKIRVLVAYTNSVDALESDMPGYIQTLIDLWNVSNANSNVNFEVELARSVEVNYTESNTATFHLTHGTKSTDLLRFWNDSDGFMDLVDDFRARYDADMCILLCDNLVGGSGAIGGQALDITANSGTAFCVMDYFNNNFTFAHEFGHLMGCRHDPYVDGTIGKMHGHVNNVSGNRFRTVMAYNDECTDAGTSCPRVQNWSNPNVNFPVSGGDPTGTPNTPANPFDATSNNAEELNDNFANVAGFESMITNKFIPTATAGTLLNEDIDFDEQADIIAHDNIYINFYQNGSYDIESGGEVNMRAGTAIVLYNGFHAQNGSKFHARIESCSDIASGSNKVVEATAEVIDIDQLVESGRPELSASPNPFIESTRFSYVIPGDASEVTLELFDATGKKVRDLIHEPHHTKGTFDVALDGASLNAGVYLGILTAGSERVMVRIVKMK